MLRVVLELLWLLLELPYELLEEEELSSALLRLAKCRVARNR